nr:hypothetical protein [Gammaproteobacteria bacterium]
MNDERDSTDEPEVLEADIAAWKKKVMPSKHAARDSKPFTFSKPLAGVIASLFLIGALATEADGLETLDAHRERWRAANLHSYVYAYKKFCECHPETPPETYVTVQRGAVVDVRHKPYGFDHYVQAESRNFEWYWTIDQLFDLVASGFESGADVRVRYDDELGYPARLFIDRDRNFIGDEIDLELTRVDPIER